MAHHLYDKQIQIAASASLFFIVKSDEVKSNFSVQVKKQIISRLLDAMQTHKYDNTVSVLTWQSKHTEPLTKITLLHFFFR